MTYVNIETYEQWEKGGKPVYSTYFKFKNLKKPRYINACKVFKKYCGVIIRNH